LNALENIRSSIDVAERGRTMPRAADMNDLARLALAESVDAAEVLTSGALANHVDAGLRSARIEVQAAGVALRVAQHLPNRQAIGNLLDVAIQHLRNARSALANPTTLPTSFRN